MIKLLKIFPKIIKEASKSPLGVTSLFLLLASVLGWLFFKESHDYVKLVFVLPFLVFGFELVKLLSANRQKTPVQLMQDLQVDPQNEDTSNAIQFSECSITIDLTNWFYGDSNRLTTKLCETTRKIRAVVKDCAEHKFVKFVCATEGVGIRANQSELKQNLPDGTKWRVREDGKEGADAPYWTSKIEHFIDQPRHKDILKKRGQLKQSYVLTVPLEEKNQIIEYTLYYQDGYQSTTGDWSGFLFPADVDEAEIRIIFPECQRFTNFNLLYGDATNPNGYNEYENKMEAIESDDGLEITWRFNDAKKGVAYVINWDWKLKE